MQNGLNDAIIIVDNIHTHTTHGHITSKHTVQMCRRKSSKPLGTLQAHSTERHGVQSLVGYVVIEGSVEKQLTASTRHRIRSVRWPHGAWRHSRIRRCCSHSRPWLRLLLLVLVVLFGGGAAVGTSHWRSRWKCPSTRALIDQKLFYLFLICLINSHE
jgi:hypothetical protein